MKWSVLIQLQRRKLRRRAIGIFTQRGLCLTTFLLSFYLAFGESVAKSPFWNQIDKGIHFLLFGCFTLAFLQYARMKWVTSLDPFAKTTILFGILISLSILSEFAQLLVPTRTFDLVDMVANISGILVFGIPNIILMPFAKLENHRTVFSGVGLNPSGAMRLKVRNRPSQRQ